MVELARINPNPRVKIIAKLEGQNTGGSASIKDRVAWYMIEKAEQSGLLTRDKIVLEATSGNTGIALAWIARLKGYRVTIVMPDSMSLERRQLLRMYGAELILTEGKYRTKGAIDRACEMAAKDNRYYMPDQFTNLANPLAHYETTGSEILSDYHEKIDYFVAGIGTGGTLTGIARRLMERHPKIRVIGVEPFLNDPIQGLRCLEEYVPPVMDQNLISERTFLSGKEATQATLRLLKEEGIFAGISSGAVVHQCIDIAAKIDSGNIVTILPDGGWKYLSMDIWR